jgi:dTDP-4-dehydrorhamnose reductase
MRILLLGSGGQLGAKLAELLPALGTVTALDRPQLDFNRPESLPALLDAVRSDIIVNAAAYTAVDRAESEPELARRLNAEAPAVLAESARRHGSLLVQYSTDYVFDGTARAPYDEQVPTAPLGVYGATKLAGEQAIRASGAAHLILRTAWLYSNRGHNFFKTMLKLAAERDRLRVVDDQIGSPTYADLVAAATVDMLRQLFQTGGLDATRTGTYHVACAGRASWCGFARRIVARAALSDRVQVEAITTAEYPTPARRPAWSVLDCGKLARDFGIRLPDWEQGLEQCFADRAHE